MANTHIKQMISKIIACLSIFSFSEALIISEIAEGSSYNKYIEFYNDANVSISLNDYGFPSASNGHDGSHEFWNSFDNGAVIQAYSTYIVAHPQADPSILNMTDETHPYLSNGNDGHCLVKGNETSYEILDCVGTFGESPSVGWQVCGVNEATADNTLVRKCSVTKGNAGNWNASRGTNAEDCEWIVKPQNDWTDLGKYCEESSVTTESMYTTTIAATSTDSFSTETSIETTTSSPTTLSTKV